MLTPELIARTLSYDPEMGWLIWKKRSADLMPDLRNRNSWNAKNSGKPALTTVNNSGYYTGTIMGMHILAHRAAWALFHGYFPADQLDHINGDKLDNRISNLREVSCAENQRNKPINNRNTSGVVGVTFHKQTGRWCAKIGSRKRAEWLGLFASFEDAVAARKSAEQRLNYHENHGRK